MGDALLAAMSFSGLTESLMESFYEEVVSTNLVSLFISFSNSFTISIYLPLFTHCPPRFPSFLTTSRT